MNDILISDPFLFHPIGEDPNPLTGYSINKYDDKSYCNKFFDFNQQQFNQAWESFSETTDNSSDAHLFPSIKNNNNTTNSYSNSTLTQPLPILSTSSVLLSPSPIEHDHSYYNHSLIYSPPPPQVPSSSSSSTLTFYTFPDTPPHSTHSDMMDLNNGLNDTFLSEFSQENALDIFGTNGEESGPLVDAITELNQEEFVNSDFVFDEMEMFEDTNEIDIEKQKYHQQQLMGLCNLSNNSNQNNDNFPLNQNDWHSQSLAVVNSGDNSNHGSNFGDVITNETPRVTIHGTRKQHNRKANIQVREAPESPMYESSMNEDSSHSSIYQQDIKPSFEDLENSIMRSSNTTTGGARRGRKRNANTPNNNNNNNSRATSTDSKNGIRKTPKMYMNENDPAARNAVLARKNREKKKEEAMKIVEENKRLQRELLEKQNTVQKMAKSVADLEKQVEIMKKKNRAEGGLQKVFTSAKDILESVMPPLIQKFGPFDLEVADWFQRVGVPGNPNDLVLNLGENPTSSYISLNISTEERKVKVNYNPDYFGNNSEPTS